MSSCSPLSRRHLLRAAGAALSLPLLESMLPRSWGAPSTFEPQRLSETVQPRMVCCYVPNGVNILDWMPADSGDRYTLSPTLAALADHRDHFGRLCHRSSIQWRSAGVCDQAVAARRHFVEQFGERAASGNLHKGVAATLFAGLDHAPFEPRLGTGCGFGHSTRGRQRNEPPYAQFGELLHHPLLPVSFRQRNGQRQTG